MKNLTKLKKKWVVDGWMAGLVGGSKSVFMD
jgi:hypothetical protein